MNNSLKLLINSVIVAALVVAGVYIFLRLPHAMSQPIQWVDHNYGRPLAQTLWFLYGVLLWGVFGVVIARLMLFLKPQNVAFYGVVSVVAFIVTMQSWNLLASYQHFAFFREVAYALTVPLLYWLLVRRNSRTLKESK